MTCGIYKIENLINNKIYIGQSIEIERRFQKHLNAKDNFIIHQALKKYGKENFSFTILEECDMLKLNEKEQYWINYYNSLVPNGYNMIPGGSNGSGLAKGKPVNQYDLNGIFIATYPSAHEANRQTGVGYSMICSCCRKEVKSSKGFQWRYADDIQDVITNSNDLIHTGLKVFQYSKKGEFIQSFNSLKEASEITGIAKSTISNVCKGKGHTAGGFRWSYENEELIIKPKQPSPLKKIVEQYDLNNNLIQTFSSLTEASQQTGINLGNIGRVCTSKAKTAGGYVWKYKENKNKF